MVTTQYLHWTSSVAQLELTTETLLVATPWYLRVLKFESFVVDTIEMVSIQYLHWTSSIAQLELTLETMLLATPWYSPQSSFVKFFIVSFFLSWDRLILSLPVRVDPSFSHDIWGSGFPRALQDNVTSSPSLFVTLWGCSVISGEPDRNQ